MRGALLHEYRHEAHDMNPCMTTRRSLLYAGLAGACTLAGLPARACEFFGPTLRVTHPWTRATPDDASSAVVCMTFDEVTQDDRLLGIEAAFAAGAEMVVDGHAGPIDLALPRGEVIALAETGTHLRLRGLSQPLELGRAYPIRLLFEQGGVLRANLTVDFPRFR